MHSQTVLLVFICAHLSSDLTKCALISALTLLLTLLSLALNCRFLVQGVGFLFRTGNHHKATEILVKHITEENSNALHQQEKMLAGRRFDQDGNLVHWFLHGCSIGKLPESFGAVVCSGDLWLNDNHLSSLPASFHEASVGGNLYLYGNRLQSLPASIGGQPSLKSSSLTALPGSYYVGGDLQNNDQLQSILPINAGGAECADWTHRPIEFGSTSISECGCNGIGGTWYVQGLQIEPAYFANISGQIAFEDPHELGYIRARMRMDTGG